MKINQPGLHGGISQQSPLLRMPNQHEAVVNAVCDVVDGLRFPRPGSKKIVGSGTSSTFMSEVLTMVQTTDGKHWAIGRDTLSVTDSLRIWNVDNPTEAFDIPVETIDYLKSGANLRFLPVLDTVFLLNKDTTVTLVNDTESRKYPVSFIYIPQVFEASTVGIKLVVTVTKDSLLWSAGTNLVDLSASYTVAAGVTDPDVVFNNIYSALSSSFTYARPAGNTMVIDLTGTRVSSGGNIYRCIQTHVSSAESEPGVGASWQLYWWFEGPAPYGTVSAWTTWSQYVSVEDLVDALEVVMRLESTGGHPASCFGTSYSYDIEGAPHPVTVSPSYESLPPRLPETTHYRASGSTASVVVFRLAEHYFVEYDPDSVAYIERAAPNQRVSLNKLTLPYKLEYNGSTWAVSTVDWDTPRPVGDTISAPIPDFVGRKINDMFYYRDRLCFLSDNYVTMSRTRSYYNFWPKTATEVLDDDPISVSPSDTGFNELRWAKAWGKQLFLLSQQKQYVLHSGYDALSPKTVAIDPVTNFKLADVEPELTESTMLMALDSGDFIKLIEVRLSDNEVSLDYTELTASVPRLLPKGCTKILHMPGSQMVLVEGPEVAGRAVYVLKYNRGVDHNYNQLAWHEWYLYFHSSTAGIFKKSPDTIVLLRPLIYSDILCLNPDDTVPPLDAWVNLDTDADLSGYGVNNVVVNSATLKMWEGFTHPDPGVTQNVYVGIPIASSVTLSPLFLRDDNGLPRADLRAIIQNLQVDMLGGELQLTIGGQGLPTRTVVITPKEYDELSCPEGKSYMDPQPHRVYIGYPSQRASIVLTHIGTRYTRVNNLVYNLDVTRDNG